MTGISDFGPRFLPIRRLSGSAMSEVWVVEDSHSGDLFAAKRPIGDVESETVEAAISREAKVLGRLDHPFIPKVIAFFRLNNKPVLVVENIEGDSLTVLRGRPADQILPILINVAECLEHVHARRIIHRDIKPANIIVDRSGRPHLIDFGIAADPDDGERWPVGGGTPGYASPWQLGGARPHPRDDLFGFGALIADLLRGAPLTSDEPVTLPPAGFSNALSPRASESCSEGLEELSARLRSSNQEDRPKSFREVIDELEDLRGRCGDRHRPPAGGQIRKTPIVSPDTPPRLPIVVPQASPPVEIPGPNRVLFPSVVGCLAVFLGLALFVVFVLLPRWVSRPEGPRTAVVTTGVEATPVPPDQGSAALRLKQAEREWVELRGRSVGRWAGPESLELDTMLAGAREKFVAGEEESAAASAAEILDRIQKLRSQAAQAAIERVAAGRVALEQGRPREAADEFRTALRIDPEVEGAHEGLQNTEALVAALEALEKGSVLERSGDFDGALEQYRQARDRAPWFPEGQMALARLAQRRQDSSYSEVVTSALSALESGRWSEAEEALNRAATMRPGAPEVRDGLERLAAGRQLERLNELEKTAAEYERTESWAAAAETYSKMLEISPASLAAQRGRERAVHRDALDRALRGHLGHPDRLSDPGVRSDAATALAEAMAVEVRGPRLEDQVERLDELVRLMSTPVEVELVSDGETEVTIYKVGRLGRFENRVLEIPPGTYTVVGARRGYRDVRLTLEVTAGRTPAPLTVSCEESL